MLLLCTAFLLPLELRSACFQGIETLLEDMVKADAEWAKLGQIPGLIDGWTDVKDKVGISTEEFKASTFLDSCSWPSTSHRRHDICVTCLSRVQYRVMWHSNASLPACQPYPAPNTASTSVAV